MRGRAPCQLFSLLSFLSLAGSFAAFPEGTARQDIRRSSVGIGPGWLGSTDRRVFAAARLQEARIQPAKPHRSGSRATRPKDALAHAAYSDRWVFLNPGALRGGPTRYGESSRPNHYSPQSDTFPFALSIGGRVSRCIGADLPLSKGEDLEGLCLMVTLTRQWFHTDEFRVHRAICFGYCDIFSDVSTSTFARNYAKTTVGILDLYDVLLGDAPLGTPCGGTYLKEG